MANAPAESGGGGIMSFGSSAGEEQPGTAMHKTSKKLGKATKKGFLFSGINNLIF
jgi:hypothetical protein